jgi:hypothetical protein
MAVLSTGGKDLWTWFQPAELDDARHKELSSDRQTSGLRRYDPVSKGRILDDVD